MATVQKNVSAVDNGWGKKKATVNNNKWDHSPKYNWPLSSSGWGSTSRESVPDTLKVGEVGFIGPIFQHVNMKRFVRIMEVGEFEYIVEKEWIKAHFTKLKTVQRKKLCEFKAEIMKETAEELDEYSDDFYYGNMSDDDNHFFKLKWEDKEEVFFNFITTLEYKNLWDFAYFALYEIKNDVESMLKPGNIVSNYYHLHEVSFILILVCHQNTIMLTPFLITITTGSSQRMPNGY